MMLMSFFFASAAINCVDLVTSINCYSCAVTGEISTVSTPSCSKFDGSSKYIIDCPYSTMCTRIISTLFLPKGNERKTVTLGCAPQKLLRHVLFKGKWKEEYTVQEIYPEDCNTMNSDNLMGATKTYCYCRGDLCNSGRKINFSINAYYYLLSILMAKYSI